MSLIINNQSIPNVLQCDAVVCNTLNLKERSPILSFSSNYSAIRNAVCSITTRMGTAGTMTGTAWLCWGSNMLELERDDMIYVVTAAHCVCRRDTDGNDIIYNSSILVENVNGSGNNELFRTQVISIDKKGDIALLEIQNHRGIGNKYPLNWTSHKTLQLATEIPEVGSSILMVGFPQAFDYNSFTYGHLRDNNKQFPWTPTSLVYNIAGNSGNLWITRV